jgi:hypothetical protein
LACFAGNGSNDETPEKWQMTNDKIPKNDQTRRPNGTGPHLARYFRLWVLGFLLSLVIGHSDFGERFPVNVERAFAKADEDDLLHRTVPLKKFLDLGDGYSRRLVHGKTVSAGADRRKSNCANTLLFGQGE